MKKEDKMDKTINFLINFIGITWIVQSAFFDWIIKDDVASVLQAMISLMFYSFFTIFLICFIEKKYKIKEGKSDLIETKK